MPMAYIEQFDNILVYNVITRDYCKDKHCIDQLSIAVGC